VLEGERKNGADEGPRRFLCRSSRRKGVLPKSSKTSLVTILGNTAFVFAFWRVLIFGESDSMVFFQASFGKIDLGNTPLRRLIYQNRRVGAFF
jgi:hypothetical protein